MQIKIQCVYKTFPKTSDLIFPPALHPLSTDWGWELLIIWGLGIFGDHLELGIIDHLGLAIFGDRLEPCVL